MMIVLRKMNKKGVVMRTRIKFIVAVICTFICAIFALSVPKYSVCAESARYVSGDWEYTYEEKDSETGLEYAVLYYCGNQEEITLPFKIDGHPIKRYPICNDSVKKIIIPEGMTSLLDAFKDCNGLETVEFPSTMESLSVCFINCASLKNVELPDGLLLLQASFKNCASLTEIEFPKTIEKIQDRCFDNCNLGTVIIPASVINFQKDSIMANIDRLIFADGFKAMINESTYADSFKAREIDIPMSMEKGFFGNSGVEVVSIDDRITTIPGGLFYGCKKLKEVSIPAGVKIIGTNAFFGCNSLEDIVLPEGVEIYDNAFHSCNSLEKIIIPENSILHGAFSYLDNLKDIIINNGVVFTGRCFSGCSNIETVSIVGNVSFVGEKVPSYNWGVLPKDGEGPFALCKIKKVVFGNASIVPVGLFENSVIDKIEFSPSITEIQACAFYNAEIQKVSFAEGLVEIGDYAFYGNLLSCIDLPNSLVIIGDYAFYTKYVLSNLYDMYGKFYREAYIKRNVNSIGQEAFYCYTNRMFFVEKGSFGETWVFDQSPALFHTTRRVLDPDEFPTYDPGEIEISEDTFAELRYYIIALLDKNGDRRLSESERKSLEEIEINRSGSCAMTINGKKHSTNYLDIPSYKGLELFDNLDHLTLKQYDIQKLSINNKIKYLYLYKCKIGSFDFASDNSISLIYCESSTFEEFNVSAVKGLTSLHVDGIGFDKLDLSCFHELQDLSCSNNSLTSLDITNNPNLKELDCSHNSIVALDVTKNTKLQSLNCSYNSINSLDVTKNGDLHTLNTEGNKISVLDVSECPGLDSLNVDQSTRVTKYMMSSFSDKKFEVYYASDLRKKNVKGWILTEDTALVMDIPYELNDIKGNQFGFLLYGENTLTVKTDITNVNCFIQASGSRIVFTSSYSKLVVEDKLVIDMDSTLEFEKSFTPDQNYAEYENLWGKSAQIITRDTDFNVLGSIYVYGNVKAKGPIVTYDMYIRGGNLTNIADYFANIHCLNLFDFESGYLMASHFSLSTLWATKIDIAEGYHIDSPFGAKMGNTKVGLWGVYCITHSKFDGSVDFIIKEGKNPVGWYTKDNKKYYFDSKGVMMTGWQTIDKKKYYFDKNGVMQTGLKTISKKKYYFNAKGEMQTGLKKVGKKTYYFNTKGEMQTGLKKVGKKTYYFLPKTGVMQTGLKIVGKKTYYFLPKTGVMQTGFKKVGKKTYYFAPKTGVMKTGWLKLKGKKYYFDKKGVMATGKKKIGKKTYKFNKKGVCLNP